MRGRIGDALFDGFNDGSDLLLVSVEVRGLVWIVGGVTEKTCIYGGATGLSGRRPNLCGCVWLAIVAGLPIGRSGCRAGQRGHAGASPDGFPGCVSSLAVSISGWPRILPVRLESSFLRWRCAVRVNGMENILLVVAQHCPPSQWSALVWPARVLRLRLAHFEESPEH